MEVARGAIGIKSHDLITVIDPPGLGGPGPRNIDGFEATPSDQKGMFPRGIGITPHDLAPGIDAKGISARGVGDINDGKGISVSLGLMRSAAEHNDQEE